MPRDDFYPDELTRQRCLTNSYDKERETRLRWYFSSIKPSRSDEEGTSKQHEVLQRRLKAACPKPTEQLKQLREKNQSEYHLPRLVEEEQDKETPTSKPPQNWTTLPQISDMRAVSPDTRTQLYKGTSREGEGRAGYLRARQILKPEVRYSYPLVSSWEYGWRLNDSVRVEDLRNPEHGRNRVVADTFYRNCLTGLSHIA